MHGRLAVDWWAVLVQRGGAWRLRPAQSPLRYTKCSSRPVNGQCTTFALWRVKLWNQTLLNNFWDCARWPSLVKSTESVAIWICAVARRARSGRCFQLCAEVRAGGEYRLCPSPFRLSAVVFAVFPRSRRPRYRPSATHGGLWPPLPPSAGRPSPPAVARPRQTLRTDRYRRLQSVRRRWSRHPAVVGRRRSVMSPDVHRQWPTRNGRRRWRHVCLMVRHCRSHDCNIRQLTKLHYALGELDRIYSHNQAITVILQTFLSSNLVANTGLTSILVLKNNLHYVTELRY